MTVRKRAMTDATPLRKCLACGHLEPVAAGEPVWPRNWRCSSCASVIADAEGVPMFAPALADTLSGFDPELFAQLAKIEATNFWFVARNRLLTGLIDKYFPEASSFLEVGCGNGAVLSAVAQRGHWTRLAGSELHPTGLAFARDRVPVGTELVQMDARAIPAANAFDVVGAFDVIEHIDEDEIVLKQMRQATRLGGGAIVAVPQHPSMWSQADEIAQHKRRYRRGELEDKLVRNGFRPVFSTSYTSLLLPLMVLNRRKAQAETDRDEIAREFALPPLLNAALTAVLRVEVAATLRGFSWPIGGSRIVVARAA